MKKILEGYQNEFMFVLEFNNKMVKELNPLLREVIDDMFPNANDDSLIKSWRNHHDFEKGDILIKINNEIKTISIKMGSRNSIHTESLIKFKEFLMHNGIDKKVINDYCLFHYGVDNDSSKILSSSEYCDKNEKSIKNINEMFAKINVDSIINKFILNGNTHPIYEVSGIIYGIPNDFFWINKKQIKEIIEDSLSNTSKSVHYGCLFIQPYNRCINNNEQHLWQRDYIQVKWYSLFDDIIKYKNKECYINFNNKVN